MGEFNVNKSTGGLEQTAGMPSEYPATQVMLSDGVTSVEDIVDDLKPASDVEYTPNTTNLNNISIRRSGNVVVMNLQTKSIAANTTAELLMIAEGYRPNNNIITMANNGDVTKFGQLMLEASTGKLTAYGTNQTAYYGSLTYIIG